MIECRRHTQMEPAMHDMGGANDNDQQSSNLPAKKNGEQKKQQRAVFHKSMGTAAGLRKLLPAGTTLAFETMAPSFTRGGQCSDHDVNFAFTWALVGFLTFLCAALGFTDSVTDKDGNTHYGVATLRGFKLFNCDPRELQLSDDRKESRRMWKHLKRRKKARPLDLLHALLRAAVFGVLAFGDAGVQRCLVPRESRHWKDLLSHLPLAVGFLATFVFMIWPSDRNGIGGGGGAAGNGTEEKKEHTMTTTAAAKNNHRFFDKTMGTVASLSKLLPTGTTLAFETLAPPFTKGGQCKDHDVNFISTWVLISVLTLLCAALRFTDSVTDRYGNTYYGVATIGGFKLFNHDPKDLHLLLSWEQIEETKKVRPLDLLHALLSAAVFMVLALCNAGVQTCLVPREPGQWAELLSILPLAVGFLASFVFIVFPSNRIGIGQEEGGGGGGVSDGGGDIVAPAPAPAPAPAIIATQHQHHCVVAAGHQLELEDLSPGHAHHAITLLVDHPSTSYQV